MALGPPWRLRSLRPSHSLCLRLGLAIGVVALGVALLGSWLVGRVVERTLEKETGQELALLANQMADRLDRGMFDRYREIQLFAPLLAGPGGLAPPERARRLLDELQRTYEHHAWLGLADAKGVVEAATGGLLEGQSVANRRWYQRGRKAPYVGDVHESVLLADLLPSDRSGEPPRLIDIAAPVRGPSGETVGVLASHLSWEWADEVRSSTLSPVKERQGIEMFILARDGSVLLGPADARPLVRPFGDRPEAAGYVVDPWGEHAQFVSFAPARGFLDYPGLGWTVVVRQDAKIALAPARALERWILMVGLVAGGGVAAGMSLLSAHLLRPLGLITTAAERIRAGERGVTIPLVRGRDEIARLASSLHHLVRALTAQEAELEAQVRERDGFLSVAAHELKTPVAGLTARVQLLERRLVRGCLDAEQLRGNLADLRRAADQMARLTARLFDLSQLEAGKLRLQVGDADLSVLVVEACEAAQARAPEHVISCCAPAGARAEVDARRMQQVLTNLLDNAVKFSPDGGLIEVELSVRATELVLTIRDYGLGIEPERRGRLFEKHYQAHAADHRSGLGLGLFLSRQIVELHGGTLTAEFPEDGGTRMTVVLPAQRRPTPPEGGGP